MYIPNSHIRTYTYAHRASSGRVISREITVDRVLFVLHGGWILKTGRVRSKTIWSKGLFIRAFERYWRAQCAQLAITLPRDASRKRAHFVAETNVADKNERRVCLAKEKRKGKTGTFRENAYSYSDATGGSKWHELICINPAITVDSGSLERLVSQFIRDPNHLPKILKNSDTAYSV